MRTPEELLSSGLAVIERAFRTPTIRIFKGPSFLGLVPDVLIPLFSGGHDSACACFVASKHPKFTGEVFHIDTGIGSIRTRRHVKETCDHFGWKLRIYKSPDTYEKFVRERGFPGPGMHQWAYVRLKERCIRMMTRHRRSVLVTGSRSQESVRRMGHVQPLKIGEEVTSNGQTKTVQLNRYWSAPCHDWSVEDQEAFMDEIDIPKNPVKIALGMSGECFCGAFASPGEYERVKRHCPDVAKKIDRLAAIAKKLGKHATWGTRPPGRRNKGIAVVRTGRLCSGCDLRAIAAGVVFK